MKYLLILLIASCSVLPPKVEDAVKPSIPKTAWDNADWDAHLYSEIKKSNLGESKAPYQDTYCPNGLTDENWAHLLVAMAYYESGFKPWTEYKENFKNSKGEYVISTGLFQLSLESANYYGCGFTSQEDLKDPLKNISCAVKIADRWVERDKRIGVGYNTETAKGLARYWSVMRDTLRPRTKAYLAKWCE